MSEPMIAHDCPSDGSMHENSADCPCRPERVSDTEWRHLSTGEQGDRAFTELHQALATGALA